MTTSPFQPCFHCINFWRSTQYMIRPLSTRALHSTWQGQGLPSAAIRRQSIENTSQSTLQGHRPIYVLSQATSRECPRDYYTAIQLLNTLQSNASIRSSLSSSPSQSQNRNEDAIPEMLSWLQKAGYTPEELGKHGLKFIHVAGTKGKGSVCAMIESIFVKYQQTEKLHTRWKNTSDGSTKKGGGSVLCRIGVFASPHMISPRERIRIDGHPISRMLFSNTFWKIWDRLSKVAQKEGDGSVDPFSAATKPNYFRFLTIMALHCFVEQHVRTAVIECGIGGEYDSTMVLPREAVVVNAITSIGIDHVGMLGNTIEEIAWHKAGIMRKGVPAFTVMQKPGVSEVLETIAKERGTELTSVGRHSILDGIRLKLGLEGEHQKENASLAIAVTERYMYDTDAPLGQVMKKWKFPVCFAAGLRSVTHLGRCQFRQNKNIEWFIDGAHTLESIKATADWFVARLRNGNFRERRPAAIWLIFNQQLRDPVPLLKHLLTCIRSRTASFAAQGYKFNFDNIAVATNHNIAERLQQEQSDDEQWLAIKESRIFEESKLIKGSVQNIMQQIHESPATLQGERVLVLVTGSLHTAGRVLWLLNEKAARKKGEEGEEAVDSSRGTSFGKLPKIRRLPVRASGSREIGKEPSGKLVSEP